MRLPDTYRLVLAVYPFTRGFSFVLFEGPTSPVDWGTKEFKQRNRTAITLEEIKKLVDRYRPEVLVLEGGGHNSRRNPRIRRLHRLIGRLAASEYVDLFKCTKADVRKTFAAAGAKTKHQISRAIVTTIRGFGHRVPPFRKPWMSEHPRMSLFDAAALGLTFFAIESGAND